MMGLMRPLDWRVCPIFKAAYQIPCNDGPAACSTGVASGLSPFMDRHVNACTCWSQPLLLLLFLVWFWV